MGFNVKSRLLFLVNDSLAAGAVRRCDSAKPLTTTEYHLPEKKKGKGGQNCRPRPHRNLDVAQHFVKCCQSTSGDDGE